MQSFLQDVGLVLGQYMRPRGHGHTEQLSFPQHIQWHVCEGEGARMAVTVQMQFESVITERYEDAFVGSSIENGTTIIQFAQFIAVCRRSKWSGSSAANRGAVTL